ncbi:uncharacterized protein CC84DRAFT_1168269 [Paraphaeosphaeria sporulosa]|uniref:Uncharacterized protein n=1 Tax=Paraphaeosphaeria sporulosa TaxID=1460663 RepID=A0A177C0F7_9PLEO|nr:uncharacterized protein CC84DRAFT_1168269 [Paraphaeosphaeria sporulosa]OAG01123.1 hypothetical protein CC84DRAFT_1168269 [Paraphaeosphaeria sporulosa]
MGQQWQPYLYDAPSERDSFNPKAVTIASRLPPPSPKRKPEGPLINFNRHPDSYVVLPYGNTGATPMDPRVKVVIKVVRWIQFALRICTLLGAVGALLCAIFIKGAQDTESWIMRIPPGVDIVICLYAIYHLLRNAKSRPPASSASYHFFALVMDCGFIPFYVFTALLSKRNLNEEAGTEGRWRTFFPTDEETDKVLLTAWLTATTVAGLHLASIVLDLYLVYIFRKIARLPPDMNPLEENLTSRRKTKHKHKNSSISAITPLTQADKRFSAQTTTTLNTDYRNSQAAPLITEKEIPSPDRKQMSFMHTRTNSDTTYSPHTPNSARQSREKFTMSAQANSARQSRADLNRRDDLLQMEEQDDQSLAERKAFLAQQAIKRNSRPNSFITSSSKQDFYTPPSTATTARSSKQHEASGDLALQNSRELQSDNWFVYDENEKDQYPEPKQSLFKPRTHGYGVISPYDNASDDEDFRAPMMMPQPLRMNPPTPPPSKTFREAAPKNTPPPSPLKRTTTVTSVSTEATFNRSNTVKSAKSAKSGRYYGDLKAATQGIRGSSPANSPGSSPTKSTRGGALPSAAKQYTTNAPAIPKIDNVQVPFSLDKKSFASVRKTGEANYTPGTGVSPRVVSRSGVDYMSPYDGEYSDLGTPGRRRDVSGKVAEEGRGGVAEGAARWGGGLTYRKASGVA